MMQKVLKVGTSAAVTIPKSSLAELGLNIGDMVSVFANRKTKQFIIEPRETVNHELIEWTDKFIAEYRPALEELADK